MNYFKPVKNFTKGRTQPVKGIVVHIGEGTAWQIYNTFNSEPKSAQYLVLKNGDIWQFVLEQDTAWHAGYKDRPIARLVLDNIELNPNTYLIGIEFEGYGTQDITEIQYVNGGKLIGEISKRHGLGLNRNEILRHHEIRQSKTCPGLLSVEKLIRYAQSPPQISEIESIQVKLSLLQKLLELLRLLQPYQKLGADEGGERGY